MLKKRVLSRFASEIRPGRYERYDLVLKYRRYADAPAIGNGIKSVCAWLVDRHGWIEADRYIIKPD